MDVICLYLDMMCLEVRVTSFAFVPGGGNDLEHTTRKPKHEIQFLLFRGTQALQNGTSCYLKKSIYFFTYLHSIIDASLLLLFHRLNLSLRLHA